jgi:hypothetical protein
MRADGHELQRLGSGGVHPASLQARAGAFLQEARPVAGLADAQVVAIESSLTQPRRANPRPRLVPVLVAALVVLAAGSVMALVTGWRPRIPFLGGAAETQDQARSPSPHGKPAIVLLREPETPPSAEAPPSIEALPRAVPRRLARPESAAPLRSPIAEPTLAEGALSIEARSLAEALARWRRDGQAEAALALLAAHERRFPQGGLAVEAKVARAEILLALGRRDQALAVLDALTLANLPRARELETLRGELRAGAGRCRDARFDLSRVLASGGGDDLGVRAARALASCP